MKIPKNLKPKWTTIVMPEEYNIEKEVQGAVKFTDDSPNGRYVNVDIGKLVGLYLAYKAAYEENLYLKLEVDLNNEFARE